jgi:transcriptional regulator with XRE-family HTH domain
VDTPYAKGVDELGTIGHVIRALRESAGLSRNELCNGICSEKYLYLIEKGLRTPSAEIQRFMSNRLQHSIFDYFEYLDCRDPIRTRAVIERLDDCRYMHMFDKLGALLGEAAALEDFQHEPWIFEYELNRVFYETIGLRRYAAGVADAVRVLEAIPAKYRSELFTVELRLLLHFCYQNLGNPTEAKDVLQQASDLCAADYGPPRYVNVRITTKLNWLYYRFQTGDYQAAVREGTRLYRYQLDVRHYRRLTITCFFIAFSYLHLLQEDGAYYWFKQGIYLLLATKVKCFYSITYYDEFWEMLHSGNIPAVCLAELDEIYDVTPGAAKRDIANAVAVRSLIPRDIV